MDPRMCTHFAPRSSHKIGGLERGRRPLRVRFLGTHTLHQGVEFSKDGSSVRHEHLAYTSQLHATVIPDE